MDKRTLSNLCYGPTWNAAAERLLELWKGLAKRDAHFRCNFHLVGVNSRSPYACACVYARSEYCFRITYTSLSDTSLLSRAPRGLRVG